MKDDFHFDPTKDLKTSREIVLDNGNKYHVQQRDTCPFGYWYIHMDKGQVPESLKGAYTSFKHATVDIEKHLALTSKKKIKEVRE